MSKYYVFLRRLIIAVEANIYKCKRHRRWADVVVVVVVVDNEMNTTKTTTTKTTKKTKIADGST